MTVGSALSPFSWADILDAVLMLVQSSQGFFSWPCSPCALRGQCQLLAVGMYSLLFKQDFSEKERKGTVVVHLVGPYLSHSKRHDDKGLAPGLTVIRC